MTAQQYTPQATCARCARAVDAGEPYVVIMMQWERMRRNRITVRHAQALAYVHEGCTEGLTAQVTNAAAAPACPPRPTRAAPPPVPALPAPGGTPGCPMTGPEMSGPAHYRESERLLARIGELNEDQAAETLAAAQVHATLALAAATAYPAVRHYWRGDGDEDLDPGFVTSREWAAVAS